MKTKETIFCKECKFNDDGICGRFMFNHKKWGLQAHYVEDDDFCLWGKIETEVNENENI